MVDNELFFVEKITEAPSAAATLDIEDAPFGVTHVYLCVLVKKVDPAEDAELVFSLTDSHGVEIYAFSGSIDAVNDSIVCQIPPGVSGKLSYTISEISNLYVTAYLTDSPPFNYKHSLNKASASDGTSDEDDTTAIYSESFSYTLSSTSEGAIPLAVDSSDDVVTLYVDWGDGTAEEVTAEVWTPSSSSQYVSYSHSYESSGTYTVTVYCNSFEKLYFCSSSSVYYCFSTNVSAINSKLPAVAGIKYWLATSVFGTEKNSLLNCFYQCTLLTSIPEGLFDNNTAVTDFNSCFASCSSLTSIPEGLFDNNAAVTDFSYCFRNCTSLTSIPEGLFDNNTAVTDFNSCFYRCSSLTSIPEGLFDNNAAVTDFSYCFTRCSSLTSIPEGLFDNNTAVTDFNSCFYYCTGLTSIPDGLFDNNTAVTDFNSCFYRCSSLTSIPEGLFDNNAAVTDFSYCFTRCSSLTSIPEGLFDNNAAVTDFNSCFYRCSSLTSIPEGLFDNNTAVTDFNSCFYRCSSLTSIPEGLFDNNAAVTDFSYCFRNCTSLTSIPSTLLSSHKALTTISYMFANTGSFDLVMWIRSEKISSATSFIASDSDGAYSRTIYVVDGSTTQTTLSALTDTLGFTLDTYTPDE